MAQKVAILGGTGKMGQWFTHFFQTKGYEVVISGSSPEKSKRVAKEIGAQPASSNQEAVLSADIVLVATPIESTAQTIREVKDSLNPGTILFDIASVKGDIPNALEEAASSGARSVSVHPLFGPGAATLSGKRIIIIPISQDTDVLQWLRVLFENEGAEVNLVDTGEEHDRMVAITLSLTHFVNIVYAKVISKQDIREITKFAGTTFMLQLTIAEAVLSEDPNLYYVIESYNPTFRKILDQYLHAAHKIATMFNDRNAFTKDFLRIRRRLSKEEGYASAYNRFYKAFEASLN